MLFFRSEDSATEWCRLRSYPVGPMVDLDDLWRLAQVWYENRLKADYQPFTADEAREIFAVLGLTGDFWNPLPAPGE